MISSATIVVVGWFISGYLNRRHEVAKKRMEYRLETLHSFLPVFFSIQKNKNPFEEDPKLLAKLEKSRSNFQLYGLQDEISEFEAMVQAIESRDIEQFNSKLRQLVGLVRARIRNEIGLKNT